VFENCGRLASVAAGEGKDRDGVRFALAPGDLVLVQVRGASAPSVKVAFEQAR
jgi:hypothetical protein